MAEDSILIDWSRVSTFWRDWNVKFKVDGMNGSTSNFNIVFVSFAYDTIDECLSGGQLKPEVLAGVSATIPCGLSWDDNGIVRVANAVTWNIGDDIVPLKGVFLTTSDGHVIGYSINNTSFEVTNQLIIDKDTILWSFQTGGLNYNE